MAFKPGATFLIDPPRGAAVKSGRYDLFVVQRNRNPQHNSPAGREPPICHGCTTLAVCEDTTHNPIFQDVLDSGRGHSVVRAFTQMPGQPPGDVAGRDGFGQPTCLGRRISSTLTDHLRT